jgi:hypothetical protein
MSLRPVSHTTQIDILSCDKIPSYNMIASRYDKLIAEILLNWQIGLSSITLVVAGVTQLAGLSASC